MIPDKMILDILRRLWEKSQRNEVIWRLRRGEYDDYYVDFGQVKLTLGYRRPPTEVDRLEVAVEDSNGEVLWQLTFEQGEAPDWPLLFGLYREARRFALGVDSVLEDIETAVNSEGTIGR